MDVSPPVCGRVGKAADHISDASRADLQVLLRRAALLLRNVGGVAIQPGTGEILNDLAAEMGRPKLDLVETILAEWLTANAYRPVPHELDEESPAEGSA
ncbi:hypothetical protein FJW06_15220 [Mesorhizobium sp. B4-1-3]|nr:hypothetical protein FJW06_15220 [Mesorhizobium sp. B4-1-3]